MSDVLTKLDQAKELAPFQDQPAQMRAAANGKVGELRLCFSLRNGRSILSDMYRRAPLMVQRALYWDEFMPEMPICSILSVGGGILQGDRYTIDIKAEKNSFGYVHTQSANRIQAMNANYASQHQILEVEEGAYLEYLPDINIPYKNARFISQTDIKVHPTATLIYSESWISGRKHHNDERFEFDLLSLSTTVTDDQDTVLFKEKLLIEPEKMPIRYASMMGKYDVFSNVIVITPKETADRIVARVSERFEEFGDVAWGVSRLPDNKGLMFRAVGVESYHVQDKIFDFWNVVRQEVIGKSVQKKFLCN